MRPNGRIGLACAASADGSTNRAAHWAAARCGWPNPSATASGRRDWARLMRARKPHRGEGCGWATADFRDGIKGHLVSTGTIFESRYDRTSSASAEDVSVLQHATCCSVAIVCRAALWLQTPHRARRIAARPVAVLYGTRRCLRLRTNSTSRQARGRTVRCLGALRPATHCTVTQPQLRPVNTRSAGGE